MLKGKSALVTGSTSGIGLAIATCLAKSGCNIMLSGFGDKAAIENLKNNLAKEHSVKVSYSAADISKPTEVADMIKQTESEFGGLDILVNNAGIQYVSPIEDFPLEKWDAILATNLSGAFYAIKAAVTGMKKRDFGRIINISSAHGLVGSGNKSAYVKHTYEYNLRLFQLTP